MVPAHIRIQVLTFCDNFKRGDVDQQDKALEELKTLYHDVIDMKNHIESKALPLIGISSLLIGGINIHRSTLTSYQGTILNAPNLFLTSCLFFPVCLFSVISIIYAVSSASISSVATLHESAIVEFDKVELASNYCTGLLINDELLISKSKQLNLSQSYLKASLISLLFYFVFDIISKW